MATQSQARRRQPLTASQRRDQALSALATRQHGVVARRQLLALGFRSGAIKRRLEAGRLHGVHRGVYAAGYDRLSVRGRWLAAVLACGEEALLSHRSAAALWGLMRPRTSPVDVTSPHGRPRRRAGIDLHEGRIDPEDRAIRNGIPVTSLPRTLFDLAEVVDERRLERAFEEADRLGLLQIRALEHVCARGNGRRALAPIRRLITAAYLPPSTRSPLEDRFVAFCREHHLPPPVTNTSVLDFEVDALWPAARLIVELDGFSYHGHRAAFERDRARDAALQAAGYRVLRVTHRRLEKDAVTVAEEIRRLLS
jgi:hypothetical protein